MKQYLQHQPSGETMDNYSFQNNNSYNRNNSYNYRNHSGFHPSSQHHASAHFYNASPYPYTTSFALIRSILILIIVFGIIGSISQLVSGLFALASAQDDPGSNGKKEAKSVGEFWQIFVVFFIHKSSDFFI